MLERVAPNFRYLNSKGYGQPPENQNKYLQHLIKPHIESFNYVLQEGLETAVCNIRPIEFAISSGQRVSLYFTGASISSPTVAQGSASSTTKVYPSECRCRGVTYTGKILANVGWKINNIDAGSIQKLIGEIPIMVKSEVCNLNRMTPAQLVAHNEEAEEMGGYFIVNGIEKVIRMIIMPRRNYPMAIARNAWTTRGKLFTEYGLMIRCVMSDHTSSNMVLHYLSDRTAKLCITYRREQFFVPIMFILKSLTDSTDQEIYNELIRGRESDTFFKSSVVAMLRETQKQGHVTRESMLKFLGGRFRIKLPVPDWCTDLQAGEVLMDTCVAIHLNSSRDKLNLLVYMLRKLFGFARGQCAPDNADSPMNQEVLIGGHLYLMVLKEKLGTWLTSLRYSIEKHAKSAKFKHELDESFLYTAASRAYDVTRAMEYFLATGNLVSKTGLGLMQISGFSVIAEKLNFMRYLSHFRAVHRGAFFSSMRTTSVRKLLPEAWGFLCPVHTPDGAPCGLLNHLSASCLVVTRQPPVGGLPKLLCELGMIPMDGLAPAGREGAPPLYDVLMDGRPLGWVERDWAQEFVGKLRQLKLTGERKVPWQAELVLVPMTDKRSQYPGLYIFTTPARLMRPVCSLQTLTTDMVGTFEQVYMNISITVEEAHPGVTTHCEQTPQSILSVAASLTPFSDLNQSPRNMYQCQMGKQTMAIPLHTFQHRIDNKLYRLQTPQSPMVRPYVYDHYDIDNYPLGTNAVVAVISYTGYDMEDAMILNKSSYERGFAHGSIYKTQEVNLAKIGENTRNRISKVFGYTEGSNLEGKLDRDGLPPIGAVLQPGDPLFAYYHLEMQKTQVEYYKHHEPAVIDNVKVLGNDVGDQEAQRAYITMRIQRNPTIGDKFSSRHGQKGVCSQLWPVENMPFSESGMTPDILFNPHGFPSRMTIGMMVESMAGKSAAMHGVCHDASPFSFSEDDTAIKYFGSLLTKAGYNYFGTERLYSGVDGRELEADIFIGVVYYQRLRHMVEDKFQVRTTGPIDRVTHQPVKGRKRAGGIRFGEMERDALLAHGTSFLLQDRLFHCSDSSQVHICSKCGSFEAIVHEKPSSTHHLKWTASSQPWSCLTCKSAQHIEVVSVPYVFRYLVAELSAMNIKTVLDVK